VCVCVCVCVCTCVCVCVCVCMCVWVCMCVCVCVCVPFAGRQNNTTVSFSMKIHIARSLWKWWQAAFVLRGIQSSVLHLFPPLPSVIESCILLAYSNCTRREVILSRTLNLMKTQGVFWNFQCVALFCLWHAKKSYTYKWHAVQFPNRNQPSNESCIANIQGKGSLGHIPDFFWIRNISFDTDRFHSHASGSINMATKGRDYVDPSSVRKWDWGIANIGIASGSDVIWSSHTDRITIVSPIAHHFYGAMSRKLVWVQRKPRTVPWIWSREPFRPHTYYARSTGIFSVIIIFKKDRQRKQHHSLCEAKEEMTREIQIQWKKIAFIIARKEIM